MVVAQQYQKFMQYRGKVSALRIASEEVGQAFSSMDSFSADNRHLLRRGGISQSMANLILRGEKRIPGMIKDLIGELDKELAELDKFLGKTNSMSVETFKLFQKSVLSHQHKQSVILKALYEMGVNFFHSIDGQIHARHEKMEKSHVEFGQHVLSLFEVLSQGYKDKGTIAEHWSDALEYLILFLKDENELGLSQETIAHFVNSDTHPFPKYILSRYYHTQAGRRGFIDKLHKAGFRRPAIVEGDTKKIKYVDLSEDKQKEVDKIIKESLLYLLDGSGGPFIPNSSPGSVFYWDGGDSNKEYSFKHIIEGIYAEKKEKKLNDEYKELVKKLKERLLKEIFVESKRKLKQFSSTGAVSVDNIIFPKQDGTTVTWKDLFETDKDKNGLYNEDKFDEFSRVIVFIQTMLDDSKKHSNKGSLFNQFLNSNSDLFVEEDEKGGRSNDEKNKISQREKDEIIGIITRIHSVCAQTDEAGYGSILRIPNDSRSRISQEIYNLLLQLFISKSSFNQEEDYINERFELVFNGFREDLEIGDREKEYLKFVCENYDSIQSLSETTLNKFFFELLEILNIAH